MPKPRYNPFIVPWWLRQRQFHTIYGARYVPCPTIEWSRERLTTPDGDFVDLDSIQPLSPRAVLLLIHGLEGNSDSRYIRSVARHAYDHHLLVFAINLRGCSQEINRAPRLYHAGDSAELEWLIPLLHQRYPTLPLFTVGFSLGANILLKWLATGNKRHLVHRAAAVAPPLNLERVANTLNEGFNRIYTWHFLSTLKPKARLKAKQFPDLFDLDKVLKAQSMFEFDEHFIAPLHGFKGAIDYWHQSSSAPLLQQIQTQTLLVMSEDDPFIPRSVIPHPSELPDNLELCLTQHGGHVGFVNGAFPGFLQWLPDTIMVYLTQTLSSN